MWLRIKSAKGRGRSAQVRADGFVIGRGEGVELRLTDAEASRRHAYLKLLPDGAVEIRDLGSRNGTFVDGERLEGPRLLAGGEELRLGATVFEVTRERPREGSETKIAGVPEHLGDTREADTPVPSPQPPLASESAVRRLLQGTTRRMTLIAVAAALLAAGVAVALVLILSGNDEPAADPEPTVADVVREAGPATVLITTNEDGFAVSGGSGALIDAEQGLVLTNEHVVAFGDSVKVTAGDDLIGDPAEVVAVDPCADLALLRMEEPPAGVEPIPLGSQDELEQGETVVVLGYPGNASVAEELQSTTGSVSVVETRYDVDAGGDVQVYENVIQTDAPINSGNSGGPLVNLDGELVGVNSIVFPENTDQGYAVGVDLVKRALRDLEDGDGIGWLGFGFSAAGEGLLIESAIEGTHAAELGLGDRTDLLTEIDGKPVATFRDYCAAVEGFEPGEEVELTFSEGETVKLAFE